MPLQIAILAAGEGKRMRSALPKVLHLLGGRPLLGSRTGDRARAGPQAICVVHGSDGGALRRRFPETDLVWALQDPPAGTGDALKRALTALAADGVTLVLFGADPLARPETLRAVVERARRRAHCRCSPSISTTRPATDASCATARARSPPSSSTRMRRRSSAPLREINTGRHGGADRGVHPLAGEDRQSQRQRRVLPHRCRRARGARKACAVETTQARECDRDAGRQQPARSGHDRATVPARAGRRVARRGRAHSPTRPASTFAAHCRCGRDVRIDVGCIFEGAVTLADGVDDRCVQRVAGRHRRRGHAHPTVLAHRERRKSARDAASDRTLAFVRRRCWPTKCTWATSSR